MNLKHALMFSAAVAGSLLLIFFISRRSPAQVRALLQP